MIDGAQTLGEGALDYLHIAEADGRVLKESVGNLRVDNAAHKVADSLIAVVGEAARGCLGGISHHQNRRLLAVGVRTGIGVWFGVDWSVGTGILGLVEEVFGLFATVVLRDEVHDYLRQLLLHCTAQAILHVLNHYACTEIGRECLVGILTTLVLGEKCRIVDFAYVVVEGSGTEQLRVCPNGVCSLGGKTAHLH